MGKTARPLLLELPKLYLLALVTHVSAWPVVVCGAMVLIWTAYIVALVLDACRAKQIGDLTLRIRLFPLPHIEVRHNSNRDDVPTHRMADRPGSA